MASIGFDQGEGAEHGWRRPTKRWAAAGLAALVLAGAAVAVSDGGSLFRLDGGLDQMAAGGSVATAVAELDSRGDAMVTPGAPLDFTAGQAVASPDSARPGVAPPPPTGVPGADPRIVKHADLAIEVDGSVTEAFERVTDVARSQGGFVVSSSTSSVEEGPGSADLVLRVPVDRFDAARADLAAVGEVRSVQVGGDDVTAQLVDLEARLRALRSEEDALSGLLGQAGNVGEVLAVRQQVSATRLEIEQVAAQ